MQIAPAKLHKTLDAISVAAIVSTYDVLAGLIVMLLCFLVRGRLKLKDSILSQPNQFWKWLTLSLGLDSILIFATLSGTLTLIQSTALSTLAAMLEVLRITFLFAALIGLFRSFILAGIWIGEGAVVIRK